jgi:hypothetical protein
MAKTRRRKRRTHVSEDGPGGSKKDVPKTFVFRRGRLADAVKGLTEDLRKVRFECIVSFRRDVRH